MEPLEYQPTEEDLVRWNLYYAARSSYHRRYLLIFRLAIPCIPLAFAFLELLSRRFFPALHFVLFAVLWVFIAPGLYRYLIRMQVRRLAKEGYQNLIRKPIVLAVEEDGIYCRSHIGETLYHYAAVESVSEDNGYTYLLMGKGIALILPHDRLGKDTVDAFVAEVERRREAPQGSLTLE
jgi:hypothetical protein